MAGVSESAGLRRLLWLTPPGLALIAGCAFLGSHWIPPDDPFFWRLRAARCGLGALAGAGLAIGGAIFQMLFQNPLATPYTLGIASGASLAAAIGFLAGVGGYWGPLPRHTLLAFCGALAAMTMVLAVGRLRARVEPTRLLLAGVCVSFMCSAGLLLVTYLADRAVTDSIVVWLMGSLGVLRPGAVLEVGAALLAALAFLALHYRGLDLLNMGHQLAATRGVAVQQVAWTAYLFVGLLTAVIVANCGPIGFIGLMAPHFARPLFGPHALPLCLGAGLLGAVFLPACDTLGRMVLAPRELPVGIITSILGAIFFLSLLMRRDAGLFAEAR